MDVIVKFNLDEAGIWMQTEMSLEDYEKMLNSGMIAISPFKSVPVEAIVVANIEGEGEEANIIYYPRLNVFRIEHLTYTLSEPE